MLLTPDLERTLRRYLLGDLEEGARAELEERLVVEPDVFEAFGIVEDELTEDYLDGALSEADRRRYERHVLSGPGRRRALGFARVLRRRAATLAQPVEAGDRASRPEPTRPAPSGWGWLGSLAGSLRPPQWHPAWAAVAAALLVSLAANVWLVSRPSFPEGRVEGPKPALGRSASSPPEATAPPPVPVTTAPTARLAELEAENQRLQAALEQESRQRGRAALQGLPTPAPRSAVVTVALAAGLLRSRGSLARVTIPADATLVRLELELAADEYASYRASLRDPDGNELWAVSKLRAEVAGGRAVIVLLVPAAMLDRGDYQLKLGGVTPDGDREALASYPFRVARE